MRRAGTLIAVRDSGVGWVELELLHRPFWRRLLRKPRVEVIRAVGIQRAVR